MATEFQVTFDSGDPAAHAAFWAEALHYVQPLPPPGFDSWDAALDAWGVPADHRDDRAALVDPDAATVDALARLQLTARRLGRRLQLRWACQDLQALLAMMGLSEVLPCGDVSDLEPGRQAEQREQARGVQEEADPRDPPL